MKQVCETDSCYGCCACYNVCPKKAISLDRDDYRNLTPFIDEKDCIDCGLCQKVCPALNETKFQKPLQVYAAVAKNERDYVTATSGGVATTLAKRVLSNGGRVYGAAVTDGFFVRHIAASTKEELEKQKGSKYTQSCVGDTFSQAKNDLLEGKQIIYVGTSCQIDGLLRYLRKDYDNLITVNLICHGVPSNSLLTEHIGAVAPKVGKHGNVTFRTGSSSACVMRVSEDEQILYEQPFYHDWYFLGFMRKLFYRNACYSCKYAQTNRIGDITVGDFWGFRENEKSFPVKTPYGKSVVLINSLKGKVFFESCMDDFYFQERNLSEAAAENPQLCGPSKKAREFEIFRKLYVRHGFEYAAKHTLWHYRIAYDLLFLKQRLKMRK